MPSKKKSAATPKDEPRYEQIVEALETVLTELEEGGLPLDQAVDAYERGVALSNQAQQLLSEAELRIDALRDES